MTSFKSSGYQLMRIKHGILGMLVFVFMATSTVHADQFIGAKLTSLNVHEQSSREPLNIAINLGHELDTWIADLSLVAEFSRTVAHGKTPLNEDLDVDYNAVYLLWKTTRSMFVTLRAGFADNEIINGDRSQNKRGLMLGCSLGQVIGRTRLQIEYTTLPGSSNFVGIGLEF